MRAVPDTVGAETQTAYRAALAQASTDSPRIACEELTRTARACAVRADSFEAIAACGVRFDSTGKRAAQPIADRELDGPTAAPPLPPPNQLPTRARHEGVRP
ncbi:MAG: hypothetical protein HOW73_33955 [Polyangiaceae bacterium]|nr:hypothetical protein [Polyangiaceae bacterium]